MTHNMRFLPPLLLLILTLASGLLFGHASGRWGAPDSSLAAADQLAGLPEQFGPWRMDASEELGERVTRTLECAGYLFRTYVNDQTGDVVKMFVLVGPSGPTSVHDPEICYTVAGHTLLEDRKRVTVEAADRDRGEFWRVKLQSEGVDAAVLHVYYAFSTGSGWQAVDNPRLSYASRPYLYKIQLAAYAPLDDGEETEDVCHRFLQDLIPAAAGHLVEAN